MVILFLIILFIISESTKDKLNESTQNNNGAVHSKEPTSIENTSSSDTVTCPMCGKEFSGINSWYLWHVQNHSKLEFKCPDEECGWVYSTLNCLKSHYFTKHGKYLINYQVQRLPKCSICSRNLRNQKLYQEHIQNHDEMKYRCTVQDCGWMFMEYDGLRSHLTTAHKIKGQIKDKSKFMISPEPELHAETSGRNNVHTIYPCPTCGRGLYKKHLDDHIENHSDMKYKCQESECGWMYENYEGIKYHYRTKHKLKLNDSDQIKYRIQGDNPDSEEGKRYKCQELNCGWVYGSYESLVHHYGKKHKIILKDSNKQTYRIHGEAGSEEGIHRCPMCTRQLHTNKSYQTHVKIHNELTETCAESGCGWAFRNVTELHKHYSKEHNLFVTKTHKGEILVLGSLDSADKGHCPICGRKFSRGFNHSHVRNHN